MWLNRLTGFKVEVAWVGYGMVVDALRDSASAWNRNVAGVNVLLMRCSDLLRSANGEAPPKSGDDDLKVAVHTIVQAARASSAMRRGPTLVLLPPSHSSSKPSADGDRDELDDDNAQLARELRAVAGVHLVDPSHLRAAFEALPRFYSSFLDRVAHAPYAPAACSVLAGAVCRGLAFVSAPTRKCYLLDCDNTLWGGAVGELGPHGVHMSPEFVDVQARFVAMQRRGALLCLVSRNDVADVRAVLQSRRDEMALHEEHIVALRCGWGRKSDYVLELAQTLCLDPSAFVFVDDSPAECADVTAHCHAKGVGIVHVPRCPEHIRAYLDACWALDEAPPKQRTPMSGGAQSAVAENGVGGDDAGQATQEDLARTELYRQLDERKHFASSATAIAAAAASVDAFVASFNLRVEISPLDASSAQRAAQLTERTNQHNACKWQIGGGRLMEATRGRTCLVVDASDRFGHHGLVGLIVADAVPAAPHAVGFHSGLAPRSSINATAEDGPRPATGAAGSPTAAGRDSARGAGRGGDRHAEDQVTAVLHVRCWLLSCRSLHLGIEHIMLRRAAALASDVGATHLGVHWRKAERNEPAAAFLFSLPGVTFEPVADADALGLQPLEDALLHAAAAAAAADADVADAANFTEVASAAAGAGAFDAAAPMDSVHPTAVPASSESVDAATRVPATGCAGAAESEAGPLTLARDATLEETVAAVERYVRAAVAAGRVLQPADLPIAAELARILSAAERKQLARRLGALLPKARNGALASGACRSQMALLIRGCIGGERCRHDVAGVACPNLHCPFVHTQTPAGKGGLGAVDDIKPSAGTTFPNASGQATASRATPAKVRDPTYGQISQYKKDIVRPDAGVIVIPVEAAAAAAVSFTPLAAPSIATSSAAAPTAAAAATDCSDSRRALPGFESSRSFGLHPETINSLAQALSCDQGLTLHEHVAAEAAQTHTLPDAFAEVWQVYEQRGAQFDAELDVISARADVAAGHATEPAGMDGTDNLDGDLSTLDMEALHARLRRRMRHSMHLMMQQANPQSYYADVVHLEPT